MLKFFEKKELCKCSTVEARNQVISALSGGNIAYEKKIKRDHFKLKNIDIKQGKFDISYILYVSKNDYENAKKLTEGIGIETE